MQVTEIKHRLDCTSQAFVCDARYLDETVAVLRFEADFVYTPVPGMRLHHRYTDGVVWAGRNYLLYQMFGEGGALLGYRFDVCTDVRLNGETVEWTDLVLDFWVDPSLDHPMFLDEDEFAEAVQQGRFTPELLAAAERGRTELATGYRAIIDEAADLLSRLPARS